MQKIYIGEKSAVVGSANLTNNGLNGEKLVEICVEIDSDEKIKELNAIFEDLEQRARKQYPKIENKKDRIIVLEEKWNSAIANRIIKNNKSVKFLDFELIGGKDFYVSWYDCDEDSEYSDDIKKIESCIDCETHFASADKVEKNKWVLTWRITRSDMPDKSKKPSWLYIHEVFENGIIDEGYEYPKCAIQRNDLEVPPPPFEITGEVAAAFREAIQDENIAKYLIQKGEKFSLEYSLQGIPSLINKMKECMAEKTTTVGIKKRRT